MTTVKQVLDQSKSNAAQTQVPVRKGFTIRRTSGGIPVLLLFVSDPTGRWVWSYEVQSDRSLAHGEPFYHLEANDESSVTGALGMTVDSLGYLYVTTEMGIQVCDQPGRVVAIINPPGPGLFAGITFGGPDLQDLYVVAGDKLFKRHLLRKGVLPWVPQKPPVPQL